VVNSNGIEKERPDKATPSEHPKNKSYFWFRLAGCGCILCWSGKHFKKMTKKKGINATNTKLIKLFKTNSKISQFET
jgi:hypothetical protein